VMIHGDEGGDREDHYADQAMPHMMVMMMMMMMMMMMTTTMFITMMMMTSRTGTPRARRR
jgi:hypothetical protein